MTTKTIKAGQYDPATVRKVASNRWKVRSRSEDRERTVTRHKRKFTCDCPAISPTCYHVTSVVMQELKAKGWIGQVWTSPKEARRQRRKTWTLTRNGQTFWMTGRPAKDVRRPHKRGRFIGVATDVFGHRDAHWVVQGFPGRYAMMK